MTCHCLPIAALDRRRTFTRNASSPRLAVLGFYDVGQMPAAVRLDWHTDRNDRVRCDFIVGAVSCADGCQGIARDDTVAIYVAATTGGGLRTVVSTLFGRTDVRLLDGGRDEVP
jgi:3-mercaptopyruvate sulfurtransferase SseA